MTSRLRASAAGVLALYAGLAILGVVSAREASAAPADPDELKAQIRQVRFLPSGHTEVTVSVTGSLVEFQLGRSAFALTEGGAPVTGLETAAIYGLGGRDVAVAMLFDVSGSSQGAQLSLAKTVAQQLMTSLPLSTEISVISFGTTPSVLIGFTQDRAQSTLAINSLQARGRGAIWDAIVTATDLVSREGNVQGNIVMFSDGRDTASKGKFEDAVEALQKHGVPLNALTLIGDYPDVPALRQLGNAVKGGSFFQAKDFEGLNAAIGRIAQTINSQYVLTYPSEDVSAKSLDIGVTVSVRGKEAIDSVKVANTREVSAGTAKEGGPLLPALAGRAGLYIGAAFIFVVIMLFIAPVLAKPPTKQVERMLQRSIDAYETAGTPSKGRRRKKSKEEKAAGGGGFLGGSALGVRAVSLATRVPRPKDYDEKMQKLLDQAGWPLRSTEFIVIQVGAIAAGALIGFVLLLKWFIGILLIAVGAIVPRMILSMKIQKREAAFLTQLPETLQLLAGSLQAGYGFLQALDTVSKETAQPTGGEFARVLAEARLGMPVEEALDNMANRIGGEDFRWVVLAVNIQRQVGGNLAALLHTVAATLREREAVRRQIKTLSAEGRLSAVVLVALPFVLFGYLSMVNPEYMGQLTGSTLGKLAMVIAMVLIGLGIMWMRKIIKIDV